MLWYYLLGIEIYSSTAQVYVKNFIKISNICYISQTLKHTIEILSYEIIKDP